MPQTTLDESVCEREREKERERRREREREREVPEGVILFDILL